MENINHSFASIVAITQGYLEPNPVSSGIVIFLLILGAFLLRWCFGKLRRRALAAQAGKLGLRFNPERDYDLAARVQFLESLGRGTNHYACNIIQGIYRGHPVRCFDYHFATGRMGRTRRRFSVYMLQHPVQFPRLEISPKSFLDRMDRALGLGMESVHFESMAFTNAFAVNTVDRRFAYDVCHPRMMEFLMQHPDFFIEFEGNCVAVCYRFCLNTSKVRPHLDMLVGIRERMPGYLYAE